MTSCFQEYNGGPFPFFSDKDPLSEMVSAMLSHRTKNRLTGIAYQQLRQALPTWEAVRDAPVENHPAGHFRCLLTPR